MNGLIKYGNYSNDEAVRPLKVVELDGPTEAVGGNWEFAYVNTNGHEFVQSKKMPGLYLDGVKQDNHTREVRESIAAVTTFIQELESRSSVDGPLAWAALIDIIHTGDGAMLLAEFRDAYTAQLGTDNLNHYQSLLALIQKHMPQGWGWVDVRDWVNSKTVEQLMGDDTELVRVVS